MSEPKRWGYFAADGTPVALGDAWHDYECPRKEYRRVGYEHHITGEWVDEGVVAVACPFKWTDVKTDTCTRCGLIFRYP